MSFQNTWILTNHSDLAKARLSNTLMCQSKNMLKPYMCWGWSFLPLPRALVRAIKDGNPPPKPQQHLYSKLIFCESPCGMSQEFSCYGCFQSRPLEFQTPRVFEPLRLGRCQWEVSRGFRSFDPKEPPGFLGRRSFKRSKISCK